MGRTEITANASDSPTVGRHHREIGQAGLSRTASQTSTRPPWRTGEKTGWELLQRGAPWTMMQNNPAEKPHFLAWLRQVSRHRRKGGSTDLDIPSPMISLRSDRKPARP